MRIFTIAIILLSLLACARPQEVPVKQKTAEAAPADTQYRTEMDEIKKSLKGDIKIKLKRDGKGAYTWEIAGKDAQEILRANEHLKRKLADVQ
jgi:hypothetical protein